ncbi:hypothetical protein HOLleu_04040 [Holothuria leucospilota]|uniref:Uncharacterized protein n=1 Tax=Holothuria leucospilota TaxID=206669 RepID=A0A9Q1HLM9_HOLLE|nr:hypothetical protein HOLleu_04040 [Holothuria leucospilota]
MVIIVLFPSLVETFHVFVLQKEAKMSITRVKFSHASRVCAHVKPIPLSCLW